MTPTTGAARERPILFSAPMVRALLAGTKTQTRRLVKANKECTVHGRVPYWDRATVDPGGTIYGPGPYLHLPYSMDGGEGEWASARVYSPWAPGDVLWVRETLKRRPASVLGIEATNGVEEAYYAAGPTPGGDDWVCDDKDFNLCPWWRGPSLPSIHMPRFAARLLLRIDSVRVQRVQEISEEDAEKEGVQVEVADQTLIGRNYETTSEWFQGWHDGPDFVPAGEIARASFRSLWDSTYGAGAWDLNPWVWVLSFSPLPSRTNLGAVK